jgi:hypothetical protein
MSIAKDIVQAYKLLWTANCWSASKVKVSDAPTEFELFMMAERVLGMSSFERNRFNQQCALVGFTLDLEKVHSLFAEIRAKLLDVAAPDSTVEAKKQATAEIVQAFDDYYTKDFFDVLNRETGCKKRKFDELEGAGLVKLDAEETVAIAIAAVDYFIYKCDDDVLSNDSGRTMFVQEIHAQAREFKAKHGDAFDAKAIAAAFIAKASETK